MHERLCVTDLVARHPQLGGPLEQLEGLPQRGVLPAAAQRDAARQRQEVQRVARAQQALGPRLGRPAGLAGQSAEMSHYL